MPNEFNGFGSDTVSFLKELSENNTKDWFDANRKRYDKDFVAPAKAFVSALGAQLLSHSPGIRAEPRVNGSIFRINRDTRFSKDKTPYKDHLDLWFWEGDKKGWDCSGYFFRLRSDVLILGAGMHQFAKPMLEPFRDAVAGAKGESLEGLLKELEAAGFKRGLGEVYKRVPKPFTSDHPRQELLRARGLVATLEVEHPEVLGSAEFVDWCAKRFSKLSQLHGFLREIALENAG